MILKRLKYRQALNSLALGDYGKAEVLFRKIYDSGHDVQGIRHNIAVSLMAQEKFDEAEAFFLEELNDYGDCFSRTVSLGNLYYIWGKREECLDFYNRALADSPSIKVGNLLKQRLRICENPETFSRIEESLRLLKEGRSQSEQKEYDTALKTFERSFELDPSQFQSMNEAGVILLNQKNDPGTALKYFKKALGLSDLSIIRKNKELAMEKLAESNS